MLLQYHILERHAISGIFSQTGQAGSFTIRHGTLAQSLLAVSGLRPACVWDDNDKAGKCQIAHFTILYTRRRLGKTGRAQAAPPAASAARGGGVHGVVIVSSWAIPLLLPLLQVEIGDVLHHRAVDEHVAAADALQEDTVDAVVQEPDVVERHGAVEE